MAAGTHGIIRCGHAARALDDAVTAPRLGELADALAYWAARYRTIYSRHPYRCLRLRSDRKPAVQAKYKAR